MSEDLMFIRPNLQIEGLVDRFYAWLHLLAPIPAAMNLANLQLPILDSYIEQPQVHVAAVANPKMKGGFFVDYQGGRVDEIRDLRDRIRRDESDLLTLAQAVREADELLRRDATGYDLAPLYRQLPPTLAGYAELTYDLEHRATLRFLEGLLYRSRFYDKSRQSIALSLDEGQQRPFVMSTPRLPREDHVDLPLPLRHSGIDDLFGMRTKPRSLKSLEEALEIDNEPTSMRLSQLLTATPYLPDDREVTAGGRIRYFGHACLLLQAPNVAIVVDPFISANHRAGDRYTYADLPDHIDYCLITHGHQDHVVLESLLQLRGRIGIVVVPRTGSGQRQDPSLRLCLQQLGFTVQEVDDLDEIPFPGGAIVACPFLGEHCDLDIRGKATYWIRIAERTIFVCADSSGLAAEVYSHMSDVVGAIDMAFIGMECDGAPLTWLYGALFSQPVSRSMSITRKLSGSNAAQAIQIVRRLGVREAYVYAMGEEDWLQHVMATSYTPESYQIVQIEEFLKLCAAADVTAEHLFKRREFRW